LHQQKRLASSIASGFSGTSSASALSNCDILRNRAFANQTSVTNLKNGKPNYFLSTSNGLVASNPNTLRDMGATRNCEYQLDNEADLARTVSWREIAAREQELEKLVSSTWSRRSQQQDVGVKSVDGFKTMGHSRQGSSSASQTGSLLSPSGSKAVDGSRAGCKASATPNLTAQKLKFVQNKGAKENEVPKTAKIILQSL